MITLKIATDILIPDYFLFGLDIKFISLQAGSSSPVSSISGFSEIQDEGGKVSVLIIVTDHMMLVF